jgi:radical SAM family uncharacterized protein
MTSRIPTRIPEAYEPLLARVDKPGRYAGGEVNTVAKDPSRRGAHKNNQRARLRATIALAFPDLYDLGMSYHGFRILYEMINAREDFAAERVFTPWPDFARELRAAGLPLTTLETFRPLSAVEIIGFTLQHELCYTNVLETLDLAGIPVRGADRHAAFPLVIAGGEGAYSPEPMADFIDAFVLGDGEEIVFEALEAAAQAREHSTPRETFLRQLAAIPGIYVPSLYDAVYNADGAIASVRPVDETIPAGIHPRVYDISKTPGSVRPVVPLIRTVQDRTVVEIRRGCVHGCRFCHAGMITRPVRERPVEQVLDIVRQSLASTGDSEVSLLSLSTADYTEILPLLRRLNAELSERRISISLPSLRISTFDVALAAEVSTVRKSGFTFAPEAGSERLRRIINKPVDEAGFLDIIESVLRAGWKTIKMYFMIGLPGETDEDLDGIVRIAAQTLARAKSIGVHSLTLNITLSLFVPKPHTPFQWEGQIPREEVRRRLSYVRDRLPRRGVELKLSPLETGILEAVFARGDRRLGAVIEHAWRAGCRFDGWRETFRPDLWSEAFAACGLDPDWYSARKRGKDEKFPYDHLKAAPGRRYLEQQRDLAAEGKVTPDCVENPCSGCDACAKPKEHVLARDISRDFAVRDTASSIAPVATLVTSPATPIRPISPIGPMNPIAKREEPSRAEPPPPVMRVRLRFTKTDALRFIAHLDLVEAIHRIVRRSGAPVAHTQGFNPLPRIALSPPLPLGFEGLGEVADVFLLKRVDLQTWLRELRAVSAPNGLEWTGIEEIPLKAPSVQQAVTSFRYRLCWRELVVRQPFSDGQDPSLTVGLLHKKPCSLTERQAVCSSPTVREGAHQSSVGAPLYGAPQRGAPLSPARVLPVDSAEVAAGIKRFLDSASWPIEIERKGRTQQRDAREFVLSCEVVPPPDGFRAAVEMTIRSEEGTTLNPITVLGAIFGGDASAGVYHRAARFPVEA